MIALLVLVSFIGFLLCSHALDYLEMKFALDQRWCARLRTFLWMWLLCIEYFSVKQPNFFWLAILFHVILLALSPFIIYGILRGKILDHQINFLTGVILNMQSGKAFRASFRLAMLGQTKWFARQIDEVWYCMMNHEIHPQLSFPEMTDFACEVIRVDQTQTKIIDQLRRYRDHLKMVEQFRRRSSVAATQAKSQLLVLTLMYVTLLAFVSSEFGFLGNQIWFLSSGVLYLLGIFVMYRISRSFKWRI